MDVYKTNRKSMIVSRKGTSKCRRARVGRGKGRVLSSGLRVGSWQTWAGGEEGRPGDLHARGSGPSADLCGAVDCIRLLLSSLSERVCCDSYCIRHIVISMFPA